MLSKDLTNHCIDLVSLYRVDSHNSWEGFKLFLGDGTNALQGENDHRKNDPSPLQILLFFLKLQLKVGGRLSFPWPQGPFRGLQWPIESSSLCCRMFSNKVKYSAG